MFGTIEGNHLKAIPCVSGPYDWLPTQQQYGHLICDGRGTPLKVITTAANVNDVTQTLALLDGIPPVAGRPGWPRRRPDALLGDKGYDSNLNREELHKRWILPVISRRLTGQRMGPAAVRQLGRELGWRSPAERPSTLPTTRHAQGIRD
ncbi:transposase [Streptomyces virginiae]|uniref:transposase n=1 Tax=Streptomyces virginiae TaxID=1961 RepID=UPI00341CCB97